MCHIISSQDLRKINDSIKNNLREVEVSLDLGITKEKIKISKEGFYIKNNLIKIKKIKETDKSCYIITKNKIEKVQFFSDSNLYKLIPTKNKPILKISGTSMHKKEFVERIKKEKLKGIILDSGTGLGYTAIEASKTAEKIITIEFDKNVIEITKINPYSKDLFKKKDIELKIGDLTKLIKEFKDKSFDNIILDGGTPKSSGEFFSLENYKQTFRVLKNNGKLFHYIPKHHIKSGRDFASEIIKRLKKAGFNIVERNNMGSYVIAT